MSSFHQITVNEQSHNTKMEMLENLNMVPYKSF